MRILLTARAAGPGALALGLAACSGPASAPPDTPRLGATFTEAYRIDAFAAVSTLRFAPDDQLVVLDGMDKEVVVLGPDGDERSRWRPSPDLSAPAPAALAVSADGRVALNGPTGRINTFTLDGEHLETYGEDGRAVFGLAFDGVEHILVHALSSSFQALTDGSPRQVTRWPEGNVVWTSEREPSFIDAPRPFRAFPLFAHLGPGAIAVGMTDEYDLSIVDGAGAPVGRLARDVRLRGPDNRFKDYWTGLMRDGGEPEDRIEETVWPSTFPAVAYVFSGPPDGTIWVRRRLGVDDEHSPPVDVMLQSVFRLYDLFDPDTYEYLGTVEAPENVRLMDGNDHLVAGRYMGAFDEGPVIVYRVELLEPGGN